MQITDDLAYLFFGWNLFLYSNANPIIKYNASHSLAMVLIGNN